MHNLETPRMVYRACGSVLLESGAYSIRVVADQAELSAALADGWHLDQYAAKDAAEAPEPAEKLPEPAASTRADLEAEARALGVKFDGRWGDKRLSDAIAAKKAAA